MQLFNWEMLMCSNHFLCFLRKSIRDHRWSTSSGFCMNIGLTKRKDMKNQTLQLAGFLIDIVILSICYMKQDHYRINERLQEKSQGFKVTICAANVFLKTFLPYLLCCIFTFQKALVLLLPSLFIRRKYSKTSIRDHLK